MIAQLLIVHKVPLTASIFVAPSVTLTGEVDPFGMTELISHEVEIAAIGRTGSKESDHLMQSNTSLYHIVLVALLEMPIHVGIYKTEDNGLVAHEGLIVTLGIGDGLLILAAIGKLPHHGRRFPVLISLLLDGLNPIVGDIHGQSVIEAIATVADRSRETRHATHILGNGDGILVDLMNQVVGKSKIDDSSIILMTIVIIGITGEVLAQSVTVIQHGSHAIKTEAIEMELLHPILAIGKQEVNHLILTIIKAEAVPCRMLTAVTLAEILARVTGKVAQSLVFILHGMAVYDIHHHGDSHGVSLIDERLQLLGCAKTTAGSKEVAYMITETAIIRMFLYSHYLYAIVTLLSHTRQYIVAEFHIRAHLLLILSHTDMAFVDEQGIGIGFELICLPYIGLLGRPSLSTEYLCLGILHYTIDPCRYAFSLSTFPMNTQFEERAMLEGLVLNLYFPISRLRYTLHGKLGTLLPTIEVTYDEDFCCIGSPFTQYPPILFTVQAEIEIAIGKFCQLT